SANNLVTDTTTGTKIGTATNQKIAFYNSTPIVQPTGDVATALANLGLVASPTIAATTITSRTLWGQTYDGSGNVTGSLTSVGNITGGASSMTILAGTGASRTLTFQTTTAGSAATTALTLAADQSATFANTVNATTFVGALTGNVTGNVSGSSGSTTGNAATATALQTPRAIYGNNFDGTAALTQVIASTYGGTGNGFTKFTGPTTTEKTFTLPDASATLLYAGGPLGTPSSGVATNLTGTASGLTAGSVTNATLTTALTVNTGTVTLTGNAANTSVLTIGAGAVSVSGSNTGDNAPNSSTMYIGTTAHALNRTSASEGLSGITSLTPGADFTLTQNSVAPFTSVESGAVANTLYLKTGNVGVGTTAPNAPLEVFGTSDTASSLQIKRSGVSGNSAVLGFRIASAEGVDMAQIRGMRTDRAVAGDTALGFYNLTNNVMTESMRILDNGNVGIGVTNPSYALQVGTNTLNVN